MASAALFSVFGALTAAVPVNAAPPAPYEKAWSLEIEGWNRSSSPLVADIDSDGRNEIVLGHQDGTLRAYEGDGSLKWARQAVPGVNEEEQCQAQTTPTAIDSSPAAADIDGDGDVEVVVGVGSTFAPNQNGSVVSFDGATGTIEWAFDRSRDTGNLWQGATAIPDGWCEGTYATPAIGDVDGDGRVDVVFGSWDFYIWAVDGHGVPLPGFPINNDDTVWSSPALFDVDGDGDVEIFIGGDSTPGGYVDHLGGIFRAIDYRDGAPVPLWHRLANEVYHSSAAIDDINGDGRFEAVVGMGNNWRIECTERANTLCSTSDGSDHSKVWAYHLDDGTDVPGWPVSATDTVWASPAIGDVDADGRPEVVVGSFDHSVYVWNGDGSLQWSVAPEFGGFGTGRITAPAVIADLDGDSDQDVAVGTDWGLALLDGRDGSSLEENFIPQNRISHAYSHETAPAVGEINGSRHIVVTGFDTPHRLTRVAAYKLPTTLSQDAWPMFRYGATRTGAASHPDFSDVADAGVFAASVQALTAKGILDGTGCTTDSFCPRDPVRRWMMAVWLVRALDDSEPTAAVSPFADVDSIEWWAPHVIRLAQLGVTQGCKTEPLRFCPEEIVTRGQMASFLVRAFSLGTAEPAGFVDIDGNTHAAAINALAASRITAGCATQPFKYCPDANITKAAMSTFIVRALGLVSSQGTVDPSGAAAVPVLMATFAPSGIDPDDLTFTIADEDGVLYRSAGQVSGSWWSPDGSRVAYAEGTGSDQELYVVDADGTDRVRLTSNRLPDVFGGWSPDGSRVAYAEGTGGSQELYVVDADGTDRVQLTSNRLPDMFGGWSPDGSQFVVANDYWRDRKLFIVDVAARTTRQLTYPRFHRYVAFGGWSYNGSLVAFTSGSSSATDVYVIDTATNGTRRLSTDNNRRATFGGWFPGDDRVAYYRHGEVYVVGVDGSNLHSLTDDLRWVDPDRWRVSPTSASVALENSDGVDSEIFVVSASGSEVVQLTYNRDDDRFGDWSPDGMHIAVVRNGSRIVVVDAESPGDEQVLADFSDVGGIAAQSRVSWTPHGILVDLPGT